MNGKERCQAVIEGITSDKVPIFPLVMGFAASNMGITYRQFASDYMALSDAQLKFAEDFNADAITTCSDAFRISADLGGELNFPLDKPPHLSKPLITDIGQIKKLKRVDVTKGRTADRIRASERLVKFARDKYVLGWVDMPFAEACSLCGVAEFMYMLYDEPEAAHELLEFLTGCVTEFATAQCEVGCDMIGCGDAAASLVSREFFEEFALPYEKRVVNAIHEKGTKVKLHICGDTTKIIDLMCKSQSDLYNIDHLVDLRYAKDIYKSNGFAVKGNINPVDVLKLSAQEIVIKREQCKRICSDAKYMISCGCEIPPDCSAENVAALCGKGDM